MCKIARSRVRIKPTIPVLNFRSYIDTHVLMLATPRLMTIERKRLREAYGAMPKIRSNHKLGYTMIPVQCPQRDLLYELHDLHSKYDGAISRADFAFEADPDPNMSVDEQMAWIKAHLIMNRRPAGPILEIKNKKDTERNGLYFIPHAHTSKPEHPRVPSQGFAVRRPQPVRRGHHEETGHDTNLQTLNHTVA